MAVDCVCLFSAVACWHWLTVVECLRCVLEIASCWLGFECLVAFVCCLIVLCTMSLRILFVSFVWVCVIALRFWWVYFVVLVLVGCWLCAC